MITIQTDRKKAMDWWVKLSFEEKFYALIEGKEFIEGYPDRNPDNLTGREIELIFKQQQSHV